MLKLIFKATIVLEYYTRILSSLSRLFEASVITGRSEEMDPEEEKKKLNEEFVDFIRRRSETDVPRYTARLKTYVDLQRKRDRATAARRNHTTGHHDKILGAKKKPDDEQKDKNLENALTGAPPDGKSSPPPIETNNASGPTVSMSGLRDHTGGDKERLSRRTLSTSGCTSAGSYLPLKPRPASGTTDEEPDPFSIEPFVAAQLGFEEIREADKYSARARTVSRSRSGEPVDRCGRRRRRRRSCRRRRRRRRSCRRRRRRRRSCRRRRSRRRRRRSCCRRRRRVRRRRRC